MHQIDPFLDWRRHYDPAADPVFLSFTRTEATHPHAVYNNLLHPDWQSFGSDTLYHNVLFVDYKKKTALVQLIGEWNDVIENDISTLKDSLIAVLSEQKICHFIFVMEYVLQAHLGNWEYYELWQEELVPCKGSVSFLNLPSHNEECFAALAAWSVFSCLQLRNWRQYAPLDCVKKIRALRRA